MEVGEAGVRNVDYCNLLTNQTSQVHLFKFIEISYLKIKTGTNQGVISVIYLGSNQTYTCSML